MKKGKLPLKGVATLAAILAVGLGNAATASAAVLSGSAFGVQAGGLITVAATPLATCCPAVPGGSIVVAAADVSGFATLGANVINSSSTGDGSTTVTSTASVTNANLSVPVIVSPLGTIGLTGAAATTSCTVTPTTIVGSTTGVAGMLSLGGVAPTTLDLSTVTTPVTLNVLGGTITVSVNEQLNPTGMSLTVNGIHIVIDLAGTALDQDLIISSSTCTSDTALAVSFRSLSASASKSGVAVRWSTASEIDLAGFNVYRQVHGKRVRVNHRMIAAASRSGHRYSFVDRSLKGSRAVGARYFLQAINLDGSRSWFGPARVLSSRAVS